VCIVGAVPLPVDWDDLFNLYYVKFVIIIVIIVVSCRPTMIVALTLDVRVNPNKSIGVDLKTSSRVDSVSFGAVDPIIRPGVFTQCIFGTFRSFPVWSYSIAMICFKANCYVVVVS